MDQGPGSVSIWIGQLKAGDQQTFTQLWERYFAKLVGLVRGRLRALPSRAADEEDVALSAFDSFFQGIGAGRFPRLEDRDDLWQVLLMLCRQKATTLKQHESRQKRGGGKIRHMSALTDGSASAADVFAELIGAEPAADFAAQVAEECQRLLASLPDERLRKIALAKMEGYSNEEIAALSECSLATVERKLQRIRKLWSREEP